jgi:hypothetical protein
VTAAAATAVIAVAAAAASAVASIIGVVTAAAAASAVVAVAAATVTIATAVAAAAEELSAAADPLPLPWYGLGVLRMLKALQCCISHTVGVSEFSKSLHNHALHQQLRLGHSHFQQPWQELRLPSVLIVQASVYICSFTFHPGRSLARRSRGGLYQAVLYRLV